jgi:hypothetical protein
MFFCWKRLERLKMLERVVEVGKLPLAPHRPCEARSNLYEGLFAADRIVTSDWCTADYYDFTQNIFRNRFSSLSKPVGFH